MKKLNKNLIISITFFLLFVGIVVANELNFFKAFTTVEVVIAKENLPKDTTISTDNVTTMRVSRDFVNKEMIRNVNDVVGKTTTQAILPSQFVAKSALDATLLRPTNEHQFFPIPNEWLVEMQGTLRRYDLINISAMYMTPSSENSVMMISKDKMKNEFILEGVPVAYVKGSKNQEVINITADDKRLYGSQNPATLQLSLTLEEFKELETLVLEGYRLIISY